MAAKALIIILLLLDAILLAAVVNRRQISRKDDEHPPWEVVVRLYDVADLLRPIPGRTGDDEFGVGHDLRFAAGDPAAVDEKMDRRNRLIRSIESSVDPGSWSGPNFMVGRLGPLQNGTIGISPIDGAFLIKQTRQNQRHIAAMLQALRVSLRQATANSSRKTSQ